MQFAAFIISSVSLVAVYWAMFLASTLNIDKLNLGFQIKSLKNQGGTDNPGWLML